MTVLHVPLDTLGTEHASLEGKLFPRFKTDDLIFPDLQLNAALLPAEATMRFYQLLGGADGLAFPPSRWNIVRMWPEFLFEDLFRSRGLSHWLPLSVSI